MISVNQVQIFSSPYVTWLIIKFNVIIATLILYVETPIAHNVVAALLITPKLSLKKMEIYYLFKGDSKWKPRATFVCVAYFSVVALVMIGIGGVMGILLAIVTMLDMTYILLLVAILLGLTISTIIVFYPVKMAKCFCWVALLGLTTYYTHLGLIFMPVLNTLMLAICVVDNIIASIKVAW